MGTDYRDEGHLQYYQDLMNRGPVKSNKKKLKLLKRLSENVSSSPQLGFASDPNQPNLFDHLQQNLITVLFFKFYLSVSKFYMFHVLN